MDNVAQRQWAAAMAAARGEDAEPSQSAEAVAEEEEEKPATGGNAESGEAAAVTGGETEPAAEAVTAEEANDSPPFGVEKCNMCGCVWPCTIRLECGHCGNDPTEGEEPATGGKDLLAAAVKVKKEKPDLDTLQFAQPVGFSDGAQSAFSMFDLERSPATPPRKAAISSIV